MRKTIVYLVGAGPGDTGLITVRGLELLQRADAVIYDYLANSDLLAHVPATAERLYVGKKGFEKHLTQQEVNEAIVDVARRLEARGGGAVVRLKGGDPCLFGRGGEEALALADAGIAFEVVPGVTSGIAAAAYAGIPVTHRGLASTVTFVAGHEDPTKASSSVDWPALARLVIRGGTVCFYMGMRNLQAIACNLAEAGVPGDMPAAVIQHGTAARQRTVTASLADIATEAQQAGLGAPSIILVGKVAQLRERISWFDCRPLSGRHIVVTRPRAQAEELSVRLAELGAEVSEFPTIEIAPPDSYDALDAAIDGLHSYDWVVFTSVNGVDAFFERLDGDARRLGRALVAAIGPATAQRLRVYGISADTVPAVHRGEALFEALSTESLSRGMGLDGARVLVPRAQEAREVLPELLRGAGADVDVVPAYKTVVPADARVKELVRLLESGSVDGVTFTSPSTVRNLAGLLGEQACLLGTVDLCSIGPVTSVALRDLGFEPAAEAAEYTVEGLVAAICGRYEEG